MSNCYDGEYDLRETLRHNLGRVCTVYTDSGGYTGILSEAGRSSCKLIMLNTPARGDLHTVPADCCDGARRVHTIPIDKISCLATSQF